MQQAFFFDRALTPQGWRRNVRLTCGPGGAIAAIEPNAAARPGDVRGGIALPGLPNLHSHAFQRAMAGRTERAGSSDDNFWSWREVMYRFALRMGPDQVEAIAAYAYADMLEAGFTSVGEFHYVHHDPDGRPYADPAELSLRILAAADATGIGLTHLPVFYATSDFGGKPPTEGQRRFINDLDRFGEIVTRAAKACSGQPNRRVGLAPHSLRAATPDHIGGLERLVPDGPVHIHIAEQMREVEACIAWSGQRPVEWLLDHAAVDARWCLVHATHMTPEETQAMAKSGAVAGLCPITEANLGDGTFPAKAFLDAGGRFGVGSDSNVSITVAGELCQLEYSQRLAHRARNVLASADAPSTGGRLFREALVGGAQALGLDTPALAPGARADFVTLDASCPDLDGAEGDEVLDTWIFSTGRTAVDKVAVGGRIVVEAGRHLARDRIDARYRAAVAALLEAA